MTWFRTPIPVEMAERIDSLRGILRAHGVPHELVEAADPGERIYADEFQIGVIPHERGEATPLPEGVVLAPPDPVQPSPQHIRRQKDRAAFTSEEKR